VIVGRFACLVRGPGPEQGRRIQKPVFVLHGEQESCTVEKFERRKAGTAAYING